MNRIKKLKTNIYKRAASLLIPSKSKGTDRENCNSQVFGFSHFNERKFPKSTPLYPTIRGRK